mgnify:CR=1 FL=1
MQRYLVIKFVPNKGEMAVDKDGQLVVPTNGELFSLSTAQNVQRQHGGKIFFESDYFGDVISQCSYY